MRLILGGEDALRVGPALIHSGRAYYCLHYVPYEWHYQLPLK